MEGQAKAEYLAKKGNHCPVCGSWQVEGNSAPEVEGNSAHQKVYCLQCEASWVDIYTLTDYRYLEDENGKSIPVAVGVNPSSSSSFCECQDCGKWFPQEDLDFIDDPTLRIEPDEPQPSGQCPDCGALCHPVTLPVQCKCRGCEDIFSSDDLVPFKEWRDCEEGPWDSDEDAKEFGDSEVGVEWRIAEGRGGYIIETKQEADPSSPGLCPDCLEFCDVIEPEDCEYALAICDSGVNYRILTDPMAGRPMRGDLESMR
jgi:hypothetical protein